MIDVLMTAVLRPELLRRTLMSFRQKFVCKEEMRLILNIDLIGSDDVIADDVLKVASEFFDNVKYRISDEPNVTKAVMWLFVSAENKYCFFLEDDWEILETIHIKFLINTLESIADLASIDLNRDPDESALLRCCVPQDLTKMYARKFAFIDRIAFGPALIKKEFIDDILPFMRENFNAEVQLRCPLIFCMREKIKGWRFARYLGPSFKTLVKDIGRDWRKKHKWGKEIDRKTYRFKWIKGTKWKTWVE